MTTDTKVAELPAAWRATGKAAGATPVAATFNACADELEAALARQEADELVDANALAAALKSMRDRMILALPPKFGEGFDGDFDTLLEAAEWIKRTSMKLSLTPPSAPAWQKAVAWRYWSPFGNCWWTRYVAPTEDTSPESTNWEPLYAAPAGQKERDKAIWRAAITLANNICVQECDRLNDDDASCEAIDATNKCAMRIRGYVEPDTEQLAEMFAEASVPHAPPAAQAVDLEQLHKLADAMDADSVDKSCCASAWRSACRHYGYALRHILIDQQAGKGVDRG